MIVHAIWAGGALPEWALEGLEVIRGQTRGHRHVLWGFPKEASTVIHARGWESRGLLALADEDLSFLAPYDIDTVRDILSFELTYGGFSAIKDLIEFIVLSIHGGLYLDISVRTFEDKDRGAAIKRGILGSAWSPAREEQEVRMPEVDSGNVVVRKVMHPSYDLDVFENERDPGVAKMTTWHKEKNPHPTMAFPHLDVWAFYAKAGSKVVENAAALMISRYMSLINESLGDAPDDRRVTASDNQPTRFTTTSIGAFTQLGAKKGEDKEAKDFRNVIIGKTVMSALYDALASRYASSSLSISKEQWNALVWKTCATEGGYAVPALGVTKLHKGSWRVL